MQIPDWTKAMEDYLTHKGIEFESSSTYDGKVYSIVTEPISIRSADIIIGRYKWHENASALKIGAEPGKVILSLSCVVSDPDTKRLTVGELIDKLSKYNRDTEVVGFNCFDKSDFFINDVTSSVIIADDMYGSYLEDFQTKASSVLTDETAGKEFVVIHGE